MYLGQMTPEAVLVAAGNANADTKRRQICEANFFSGELALQRGAKDEAIQLLRLAANDCPKTFIEWRAANAELKTLGMAP
jgi:lipoprotein NlpI